MWIGGDSASQDGSWARITIQERKVWRCRHADMIIGGSGRWRVVQVIQSWFDPPLHNADLSAIEYFVISFIPALQALLIKHDAPMKTDESGTGLTIGYRGVVYHIDSAFNVNARSPQVVSDGSGGDTARGAFQAFLDLGVPVEDAMLKALAIAGDYELTVAPPYYVERLDHAST